MGEGLAAMMVRSDRTLADYVGHLTRSVAQTILDQVSVTTSGLFTQPPLDVALAVFGIDRVSRSITPTAAIGRAGTSSIRSNWPPRIWKNLRTATPIGCSSCRRPAEINRMQALRRSFDA
jgi:hypothetical protein